MKAGHFSAKIPGQFSAAINRLDPIRLREGVRGSIETVLESELDAVLARFRYERPQSSAMMRPPVLPATATVIGRAH